MNIRMLTWPLLATLAIAAAPVAAGISIPPGTPPFCDIPEDPIDSDFCPILIYSTRDCPEIEPQRTGDVMASPDAPIEEIQRCGSPVGPITPYIECDSGVTRATCRANPTGLPDHAYQWRVEGDIQSTDDDMSGTSLTVGCTRSSGDGKIRLTVTSPWSGVSSETSVFVQCSPNEILGPADTKD